MSAPRPERIEHLFSDVDGYRVHVLATGQQGGRTLVLLHGFTGSAATWGSSLMMRLAGVGLRVIALDLPGHGKTEAPASPEAYTIDRTAMVVLGTLRQLGVAPEKAILLGYSMGGRIALYTALSASFRGLILESASPGLATEPERTARRKHDEALARRIEQDGIPEFMDYWEDLPLFSSQKRLPPEIRAEVRRERLANSRAGLASSLRGVGTGAQPSLWSALPRLALATQLIVGEEDAKFRAIAEAMAASLAKPVLTVVQGAGHAVHLDRPEAYQQVVAQFCLRLLAEAPTS